MRLLEAYSPSFPALFSRNKLPSRMYRRTICTDRCPVWFMMERSLASAIAALVACPALNNLKLSYRSDPPLQFEEIVGLLTTGKRPSSDPNIVATQAAPPQQSVAEMGETAIVSQARVTFVEPPAASVWRKSIANRSDIRQWIRASTSPSLPPAARRQRCHIHLYAGSKSVEF
jgi:hypothetical protein